MTELEKALEQLQLFLEEADYEEAEYLMTMSEEELDELFRRFKRDVRKRERVYSPNSDEYKSLNEQRALVERIEKMLRDREKENSGLMLSGANDADSETDESGDVEEETDDAVEVADDGVDSTESHDARKTNEAAEERKQEELLYEEYESQQLRRYKYASDVRVKQEIYHEVARKAECDPTYLCLLARLEESEQKSKGRTVRLYNKGVISGNSEAACELLKRGRQGFWFPPKLMKDYWDIVLKSDNVTAILECAFDFIGSRSTVDYTDYSFEAYSLLKRYFMLHTDVSMKNDNDRKALFYYYLNGMLLQVNMLRESVTVPLRELIENEGTYTEEAKYLEGCIYSGVGRYEDAAKRFIQLGTKDAIYKLIALYDNDYFKEKPQKQYELDEELRSMLYREGTDSKTRKKLFAWYGYRYARGINTICDNAIAYAHYGRAELMGGWGNYEKEKWSLYRELNMNERLVFFEKVLEYEFLDGSHYTDVYLQLGELYEKKYMYEDACLNYSEGSHYAANPKVREKCKEAYERCDAKVTKRKIYMKEAKESYEQCIASGIGKKQKNFERLRDMAKRGNTYAALRFAQVAEQDSYLRDVMKENFPSEQEIFNCYFEAAKAGEREAISRLVEIFTYGQLGESKYPRAADRWKGFL